MNVCLVLRSEIIVYSGILRNSYWFKFSIYEKLRKFPIHKKL